MQPGGTVPVAQLVMMMRSTPPQHAAGVLLGMTTDRLNAVFAAMKPADMARILVAVKPGQLVAVFGALATDQSQRLCAVFRAMGAQRAAHLLSNLPAVHVVSIIGGFTDQEVPVLLEAMGPQRCAAVLAAMDPHMAEGWREVLYRRGIGQVLGHTKVLPSPPGRPDTMVVETFGRRIVIAVRFHQDTAVTMYEMHHAEETAVQVQAGGVLTVTNAPLSRDVVTYLKHVHGFGRPVDAVTWVDARHDGELQRALVGLVK